MDEAVLHDHAMEGEDGRNLFCVLVNIHHENRLVVFAHDQEIPLTLLCQPRCPGGAVCHALPGLATVLVVALCRLWWLSHLAFDTGD